MEKTTRFTIRAIETKDISFLWDMLYEAAAIFENIRALGKEHVLSLPTNRIYVEGWGRPGDAGVISVDQKGLPLGAAWYRLYSEEVPSDGFISSTIPELAIGVCAHARGQGIGSALLQALIELARNQGYPALCLSVDRSNPALHLYKQYGFRDAGLKGTEAPVMTMIRP